MMRRFRVKTLWLVQKLSFMSAIVPRYCQHSLMTILIGFMLTAIIPTTGCRRIQGEDLNFGFNFVYFALHPHLHNDVALRRPLVKGGAV
jgi:hypothetical protein